MKILLASTLAASVRMSACAANPAAQGTGKSGAATAIPAPGGLFMRGRNYLTIRVARTLAED
jgi:hypothetical protein